MKHIFISHAGADAGIAKRLEGDLRNAGHETKIDTRELKLGDDAIKFMNDGIAGRIRLADGRILEKHYREFVRGYAVTSYASQGKTVDYVLFSDSAVKAATNDQQWYVTTSRGRKGIRIFTCDRPQLRESVVRSGRRTLALELACESERIEEQNVRRRVMIVVRQRVRQFISQRRSPVAHKPEIKNYENQRRGTQIRI
jgi:hypothetical protein